MVPQVDDNSGQPFPPAETQAVASGVDGLAEAAAPTSSAPLGFELAEVLIGLIAPTRIAEGPLGLHNVAAAAMDIPIRVAKEALISHAKTCHRGLHCPHTPPSLLKYRRMRPAALLKATDDIHAVLWSRPDHGLLKAVRGTILEVHSDCAEALAAESLFDAAKLHDILSKLGSDGPKIILAVIWAAGFPSPVSTSLFRCLAVAVGRSSEKNQSLPVKQPAATAPIAKKERRLVKELKAERQVSAKLRHELEQSDMLLKRAQREANKLHERNNSLRAEIEEVRAELAVVLKAHDRVETAADHAQRARAEIARMIRTLNAEIRSLRADRTDLGGQLAATRRQVDKLDLTLMSVPKGIDAVRAFIEEEKAHLEDQRLISFGGARSRADEAYAAHKRFAKAFLESYPEFRAPRPVQLRPKSSVRLVALGGSGEIGGSCYLLELGAHRILVDCGIKPGSVYDAHPDLDSIRSIDAVVLTHAHTDHVGWIPALVRRFPDAPIYCSEGTALLLPVVLDDCHRHYMRKTVAAAERAKYGSSEPLPEEYDRYDVLGASKLLITCPFAEEEQLPFGGISLQFHRAGHILGAASVLITDQSGRRVLFSGDFSSFPQLTVAAAYWPEELGDLDLLVLESTYGNRTHQDPNGAKEDLIKAIYRTTSDGGVIILASFGLGRAQELLSVISQAKASADLPASLPVHYDGLIRAINPIYERLGALDLSAPGLNEVSGAEERREIAQNAHGRPSVILTTSGMLAGGPVVEYARHLLVDPRNRLVLTGYQDEGAPSKALLNVTNHWRGPRVITIPDEGGDPVKVSVARPAIDIRLSAHADAPGIREYAGRVRPRAIALVHGEPDAQAALGAALALDHPKAEILCGPADWAVQ